MADPIDPSCCLYVRRLHEMMAFRSLPVIPDMEVARTFIHPPAHVSRTNPYVLALGDVVGRLTSGESMSVGRDGASDAVSFLRVGVPAVEFGPVGAGHHGPAEWVSVSSLEGYRQALESFLRAVPERLRE